MRGASTVNDEFEVGFNQTFESHWYRAEQVGRVVMVVFAVAAGLGLLGRGPFSHESVQAPDRTMSVDYEPIARNGTNTTLTIHIKKPANTAHTVEVRADQKIIEPMGYQGSIPQADSSSITNDGIRLSYTVPPNQTDVLVRLNLKPIAVGLIPLRVSDDADTVNFSILVSP